MTCCLGRKHQNLVLFGKYSIPLYVCQRIMTQLTILEDILLVESVV